MEYSIKHVAKNYKMTAFGVSFDDFNDWQGNAARTAAKKAEIIANGSLSALTALSDGQIYQINYVLDGKAWRGFGVMGEFNLDGAVVLDFLAGDYLIFSANGTNEMTLADEITSMVFGQGLKEASDYKYIGPGNATFVKAVEKNKFYGEMALRVEKI